MFDGLIWIKAQFFGVNRNQIISFLILQTFTKRKRLFLN